jgi:Zn-dependent peptidase ImmA (M78 family)/transcriptional regulator with XRE-family HTH domain
MASSVAGIHPSILRWARESQGLSIQEVAHRIKREPEEILAWEAGSEAPTYTQLERLAYEVYKRPLAVFFFPQPPAEPSPRQEFRTLPDFELDRLSADTRFQLRLGHVLQLSLKELHEGVNPATTKVFRDLQIRPAVNPRPSGETLRSYLGISLTTQTSWKTDGDALKAWRDSAEEAGIYVFKRSFKQREISGFSLWDEEFPIIYLNNSTTKTRQIFSLLHELVHLVLRMNSITAVDESYISHLAMPERRIEQFCNAVAAEVLMPSSDFESQVPAQYPIDDSMIGRLAIWYKVSREAVLRRTLDMGIVSQSYYQAKVKEWIAEIGEPQTPGGNYYATQATYLGERYLRLVFGQFYQGKLTREQVADYFGVKAKSVGGLEEIMLKKAVSA